MNAKYSGVKSKLTGQTGKTAKDVSVISDQLVAKRKSEKYKRIKCSTLAKLLSEMQYEESIYNLNGDEASQVGDMDLPSVKRDGESLAGLLGGGNADTKSQASAMTSVSAVTYATDALGITD